MPNHKKCLGMSRTDIHTRALHSKERQIDNNPCLAAKELRENNLALLVEVSVRTVRWRLYDDLSRRSCKALPKIWVVATHEASPNSLIQ